MHNPFKELPASRELHSSKYIRRYEGNPILTAKDVPYEADYVFNAGVAFYRGEYFIAPRVDCHDPDWKPGNSRMRSIATGFGRSSDGLHFRMEPEHIHVHYHGEILPWVCDARLTVLEDDLYLSFCFENQHSERPGIARWRGTGTDFDAVCIGVPQQRSVSSVLHSMKLVHEGVAPHGAWFCPEAFKPPHGEYRSLTYREIRCLVFGSIVNGATGIVPYKIGDPRTKYHHNQKNNGIFETPDMHLGYLKGIGPELKALEDVLLEPERLAVETGSKYVIATRKRHDGKEFIIAVNTMPDEAQITLTGKDLPDGDYKVLGENRTVTVKDGRLNDSFAGYMTHIYISDPAFPDPVDIAALEEEIAKTDAAARAGMKNKQ